MPLPIALPLDRKMNACVAPAANVFIAREFLLIYENDASLVSSSRATPHRANFTHKLNAEFAAVERGMWQLGLG